MISSLTTALFLSTTGCTLPVAAFIAANALDGEQPESMPFESDAPFDAVDTGWVGYDGQSNALGSMRGSMPGVGTFDEDLTIAWVQVLSDTFDLHATHADWAMLGGGFDASAVIEGERVVLESSEHWVMGCSGPQPGSFDLDGPAETIAITTESIDIDGEPHLELTIEAIFSQGFSVETVVVQARPQAND